MKTILPKNKTVFLLKKPANGTWDWRVQEVHGTKEDAIAVAQELAATGYIVKLLSSEMEFVKQTRIVTINDNNRESTQVGENSN